MFPSYRTLRCSLLLVLLSMMEASWILENPGQSTILLHPWLQWAIQTIKQVSGTDTSLKLVGPWNLTWVCRVCHFSILICLNSSPKFQGPFLEKKVTKFKMLALVFGWLSQPLGLESLVKTAKMNKAFVVFWVWLGNPRFIRSTSPCVTTVLHPSNPPWCLPTIRCFGHWIQEDFVVLSVRVPPKATQW